MLSLLIAAAVAVQASPSDTLDPAICADPVKRKAFLETYKDPKDVPILARLMQSAEDNQKKTEAKMDRLAERAHWSAQRKAEFAMSLLNDPEFGKLMDQNMAGLQRMMEKIDRIAAEKDEAKQCAIAADMMADVPAISATADKQWALMDARIDAEAQKAGVTLK